MEQGGHDYIIYDDVDETETMGMLKHRYLDETARSAMMFCLDPDPTCSGLNSIAEYCYDVAEAMWAVRESRIKRNEATPNTITELPVDFSFGPNEATGKREASKPDPLAAECLDLLRRLSTMRPGRPFGYMPGVLMGPSTVTAFQSGEFGEKQFAYVDHGDASAALLAALRWATGPTEAKP